MKILLLSYMVFFSLNFYGQYNPKKVLVEENTKDNGHVVSTLDCMLIAKFTENDQMSFARGDSFDYMTFTYISIKGDLFGIEQGSFMYITFSDSSVIRIQSIDFGASNSNLVYHSSGGTTYTNSTSSTTVRYLISEEDLQKFSTTKIIKYRFDLDGKYVEKKIKDQNANRVLGLVSCLLANSSSINSKQ